MARFRYMPMQLSIRGCCLAMKEESTAPQKHMTLRLLRPIFASTVRLFKTSRNATRWASRTKSGVKMGRSRMMSFVSRTFIGFLMNLGWSTDGQV